MSPALSGLLDIAVTAGHAVGYRNAGTVELLLDVASGEVWFLEMNTRLQVEHPVTEMVTGVDLVAEQLRIAQGLPVSFGRTPPEPSGHALELRVYAEDPIKFLPRPGMITRWEEPNGRASGWTPATAPVSKSRRSTIRCWPNSSCGVTPGTRCCPGRGRRWPSSTSKVEEQPAVLHRTAGRARFRQRRLHDRL